MVPQFSRSMPIARSPDAPSTGPAVSRKPSAQVGSVAVGGVVGGAGAGPGASHAASRGAHGEQRAEAPDIPGNRHHAKVYGFR